MFWLFLALQLVNALCSTVTIKGQLSLSPRNITNNDVVRSFFRLYQVGNFTGRPYVDNASLKNLDGYFEFKDVPISSEENGKSYYQMVCSSLDFNLKPNRILIEITNNGSQVPPTIKAFQNVFGRENFPSPELLYPEQLVELPADPFIEITYVQSAPLRNYIIPRNPGMLQSGPLASIFNSKYKLAGLITVICLLLFPLLVEKFDPETVQAMKEQKINKAKERYGKSA
ncbi:Sop4p Ecym_8133 [Eremothecium cymbalariae DBVPG|uniref:Protein SOP4 n=1 Tax=Eremothecium cymbalariae (strain CBS 270.75 / DBVPG 7215 / KCTC 17166 / NRRL Y-17582) TaxID=931890 RepID=G8JX50_ERECY|nr:Hypothetical protein Ecym_8133 [Eremothecium cymbalariae DBVPG\